MHSARFKWHTTHLPIVLAASLGVFVVVFIILGLANQNAVGWIRHTSQVRASLSMLSADLMETTRDRLMFLETGQKGFLSASASAQQIMIDRLIQTAALVQDNPDQLKRFAELKALIEQRIVSGQALIETRSAEEFHAGVDGPLGVQALTDLELARQKIVEIEGNRKKPV